MVSYRLQELYDHFQNLNYSAIMYSVEWFTTLFSISLDLTLALSVVDLFLAEVDDIMVRIGLAILTLLQKDILDMVDLEEVMLKFKGLVKALKPKEVILRALLMPSLSPSLKMKRERLNNEI